MQILPIPVIYKYMYVRKWKGKKVGTIFSIGSYLTEIFLKELYHLVLEYFKNLIIYLYQSDTKEKTFWTFFS